MTALRQDIDPNGLLEYSVVYTDRALNHMSKAFQEVMNDLLSNLKTVYNAEAAVIIPGSGTYGMEAVARQLTIDEDCLIIRNGWFSYRWTQILEKGKFAKSSTVLTAERADDGEAPKPFAPVDIDSAVAKIKEDKPAIVYAPHVETSSGIILTEDYIKALSEAVHSVGGLLVIDCIASGCVWLDMKDLGIDVLISAPQKGWSSTPCAGLVMLSDAAIKKVESTESNCFSLDLKQWLTVMRAYENGGHAYHATMPTDSLRQFRDTINEAKEIGFDKLCAAQWELGNRIREVLAGKGFESVAADGFKAPGVVVSYTDRDDIHKGSAFAEAGLQIAAGVPLNVGEPDNFKTFRLGLFGLDKLTDVDGAVERFEKALDEVLAK
ncbi:aminotransferase class V-fold PLP-dependent enzyme [Psychrobacter sp. AOP22-C1-22]|uniref:aminotransferase class V-fold PLP-dependent enzyme n=1 Tax=unclassified Psychrobacter TaxID=196806 RepID=UPI001787BA15|nr:MULTISPECIES: aminotransferase class V-fold PLP-dependent enzyme [unclassified Psychrobacter]MDN5801305.1 aminotransferase class V-fold PLP-dependent enzyme [Psychrobacter sp.]MBE0406783.1 alanine--glyoxylate aminotransferase family protein [Psychrobacter sp. FME6]MBE0445289.1 alanine--glyoxylate aminotransferase family protein [Psychrobacter sp. FME5]MDN5892372.1 aminotransferase class V-fold PLP-dependent enzyme [Psychrobacter sp.]MDN5897568.1 aminotransferase class V-fold PLP-dependent e